MVGGYERTGSISKMWFSYHNLCHRSYLEQTAAVEVERTVENFKRYESPDITQLPTELVQACD